jgi:hypothetical protein
MAEEVGRCSQKETSMGCLNVTYSRMSMFFYKFLFVAKVMIINRNMYKNRVIIPRKI